MTWAIVLSCLIVVVGKVAGSGYIQTFSEVVKRDTEQMDWRVALVKNLAQALTKISA